MEMAMYIMSILKTQLMVVWSWGFHKPMALPNNGGLRFNVSGFKFKGVVEIYYNEGHDLFDISFIKDNKIINKVDGVYFDSLIDIIDDYVEKTTDYEKDVTEQL